MSFLFQSLLTVGLPLIGLPLLIHLINLRRHRRVEWAAMEFLLESEKRNKNWVLLRQLLLLLLRTIAVAALVMMLAGPIVQSDWGNLFGTSTTHHVILLDDSFSMMDRSGQMTAFKEAKRVIRLLLEQALNQEGHQKLSFLRFSSALKYKDETQSDFELDLNQTSYETFVEDLLELKATETASGPLECINLALGLPEAAEDETRIVYLISDFRTLQWKEGSEIEQAVLKLQSRVNQLHLIQCIDDLHSNLTITGLEPEAGVRAAGVETWMTLSVKNYSDQVETGLAVRLTQDGHPLPAVKFEEIAPGEEVTRRFRTVFLNSGAHQISASLESDAIEVDNVRYFSCQIPLEFPVLVVDGSRDGDDGYYLSTALSPGGNSKPGWNPRIERPEFLRKQELLDDYAAICLLDVPRLDSAAIQELEKYVESGGGLAIYLGSRVQRPFYNEHLFRNGTGLLPVAIDVPTQLLINVSEGNSDVTVSEHPLFRVFRGQRNSFLDMISVNLYYGIDKDQEFSLDGKTEVIASLKNGAPYIVEKQFGKGKVIVHLSKLSPKDTRIGVWSNWGVNPVFPVFVNELVGYLSSSRRQAEAREVGDYLELKLPESEYEAEATIHFPKSLDSLARTVIPSIQEGNLVVEAGVGDRSGIWKFGLQRRTAGLEQHLMAVNVSSEEGDLNYLDRTKLASRLKGVDYVYSLASQMRTSDTKFAGYQLQDSFLYLLLFVLLVEQWLAHRASYLSS